MTGAAGRSVAAPTAPAAIPPPRGLPVWLPAAAYAALGGVFLANYRHHLNSDGAVYLDLARLWAEGRFREAVVGYWGPLLPALTAIPMALGMSALAAGKAVAFVVGLAWVVAFQGLLTRVAGHRTAVAGTLLAAVPVAAVVGVPYSVLPDALLSLVAILLLRVLLAYARLPSVAAALAAGALCGGAYLCKSPAWILFLPPALAVTVWCGGWLRRRRDAGAIRRGLLHGGLLVAAAAAVMAPWVVPLSARTGHPTLGSATDFLMAHVYHRAGYAAPRSTRWVPYDGERWLLHNPWGMRVLGPPRFHPRFHVKEAIANVRRSAPFFLACPVALLGLLLGVARTRRCLRSPVRAVPWFLAAWMIPILFSRPLEFRWLLYAAPVLVLAGIRFPLPRAVRRIVAGRRALLPVAVVLVAGALVRYWPLRPLGAARAEATTALRAALRGDERVWCNRTAAGIPVAFLLDLRMSPGSPFPDGPRRAPPAELVVWSADPSDPRTTLDRSRMPDHAPLADWHEEDGLHVTVLRRRP